MKVRPLRESDLPALKRMAEASGYPYPDLSNSMIECVHVAVDDDDQPIMACAAERIVQLYLLVPSKSVEISRNQSKSVEVHPAAKLHALRLLHEAMAPDLRAKGYTEVNAFLPPTIAAKFGRRLMRSFGWIHNWRSFCKHL